MAFNLRAFACLLLIVGLLSNQGPVWAKHTEKMPKRPVLLPLKPIEDIPPDMDPVELFDQAVDRYAAGQLPEAERLFEKVLKLQPGNADAHYNLGAIKEWHKDYQ